ncbi:MAG: lytic murein transglycosylase [Alphaproteobacteria bacterium]
MIVLVRIKSAHKWAFTALIALMPLSLVSGSAYAQNANFQAFIESFRSQAIAEGISGDLYDRAMTGLTPNEREVRALNTQPEFTRPIWEYIEGAISQRRMDGGREQLAANTALFDGLESEYGVPREVLTAVWAMESNFGQVKGNYNLFQALATLAYDGRRQDFGRSQLIAALKISQQEGIDPSLMTGSWAGAFGHTQFIPTTFLAYAVDGDGDGVRDLWNSHADALASAASYLERSGWRANRDWGTEVKLPDGFNYALAGADVKRSISAWSAAGVRKITDEAMPASDVQAEIILPAGAAGPAFLITGNFDAIMRYNPATSYALAISYLSDGLRGRPGILGAWPYGENQLSLRQRVTIQQGLGDLGFPTGGADGIIGPNTRQAIRDFQTSRGLTADGFPGAGLLTRILNERQLPR